MSYIIDGFTFTTEGKAQRYRHLRRLQEYTVIGELEVQVPFELRAYRPVDDMQGETYHVVGTFTPDFVYVINEMEDDIVPGTRVVEYVLDGTEDELYKLKQRIFEANYGMTVTELRLDKP